MGGNSSRNLTQQNNTLAVNSGAQPPPRRRSWMERLSFRAAAPPATGTAVAVPAQQTPNIPVPPAISKTPEAQAQTQGPSTSSLAPPARKSNLGDGARRSQLGQNRQAMKISEIPDTYDIDWSKDGQLGKGHYAVVFRGKNKLTGEMVAAKRIDRSLTRSATLKQEVQVLRKVRGHSSIVTLYDVYFDDNYVVLILELLAGGELFDRIVRSGAYSERDASAHMRKIALALKFMHDQGIVHRDLKPENLVLVDNSENSEIKISDFGLSKILKDDQQTMATICGTRAYAAPEVGFGSPIGTVKYNNKVDTWSLGVILFVVLAAYHPFDPWGDAPDSVIWERICRGEWNFNDPVWETISSDAKDLIRHLLRLDPEERYGADELLRHPWIVQNATVSIAPLASTKSLRSFLGHQGRVPGGIPMEKIKEDQPKLRQGDTSEGGEEEKKEPTPMEEDGRGTAPAPAAPAEVTEASSENGKEIDKAIV